MKKKVFDGSEFVERLQLAGAQVYSRRNQYPLVLPTMLLKDGSRCIARHWRQEVRGNRIIPDQLLSVTCLTACW